MQRKDPSKLVARRRCKARLSYMRPKVIQTTPASGIHTETHNWHVHVTWTYTTHPVTFRFPITSYCRSSHHRLHLQALLSCLPRRSEHLHRPNNLLRRILRTISTKPIKAASPLSHTPKQHPSRPILPDKSQVHGGLTRYLYDALVSARYIIIRDLSTMSGPSDDILLMFAATENSTHTSA